jgi:hypothetical protein
VSKENRNSQTVISAAFFDVFTAERAIRALTQAGFEDSELEFVGILAGRVPNLTGFCQSIGVPLQHALYYQDCFEDGGALLTIRTRQRTNEDTAVAVLKEHGGILPPTHLTI